MKSGRQRKLEIQQRRRLRARIGRQVSIAPSVDPDVIPRGAILADQSQLLHDNTYGPRPGYYVDSPFTCIDCGADEVWSAEQQKWWYEVAKGKIDSRANRCRTCRRSRRLRSSQARHIHIEGLIARHGLEDAAWKLQITVDVLETLRDKWRDP